MTDIVTDSRGPSLTSVRVVPASTIAEIVAATNQELATLRAELADLEAAILELEPESVAPPDDETANESEVAIDETVDLDESDAVRPDDVTIARVEAVLAEAQRTADRRLAEAREEAERVLATEPPEPFTDVAPDSEEPLESEPTGEPHPPEFWAEMDSAHKAREHPSFRSIRRFVGPSIEVLVVIGVFVAVLLRLS